MQTERIELRNFRIQDIDDVFAYCSQDGVGENAGWAKHQSVDESRRILRKWIANENMLAIVYRPTLQVIGHVGIYPDSEEGRNDTRELGFALNRQFQRQGIMTEAVKLVLSSLSAAGVKYVWACCFQHNIPSKKLIEKCGFSFMQEGVFHSETLGREYPSYEYRITLNP